MASFSQVYENLLLQMFETFVAKDNVVQAFSNKKYGLKGPEVEDVEAKV